MKNVLCILFFLPVMAIAQVKPLLVEGTSPDLYLLHTTGPKESFYSVGRIYNISPKIMAPYNNLILEKGLTIGQVIKIPLNDINFSQDGIITADEALVPVYHKVKPKETLYNISTTNNKVPIATLKKWNKLSSDAVPNGSSMIIGYLKVKKDLSPLVNNAVKAEIVKTEIVTATPVKQEVAIAEPVVKKAEPKKEDIIEKPVVKIEPEKKQQKQEVVTKPAVVKQESTGRRSNGGAFGELFQKQPEALKEEKGLAGIFKSTSGWEDGKYYCLHNSAQQGTIVKVTNPVNQRFIYAKVLDVIPDLKQNDGMIIRLSNAAADELGTITDNFECILNY